MYNVNRTDHSINTDESKIDDQKRWNTDQTSRIGLPNITYGQVGMRCRLYVRSEQKSTEYKILQQRFGSISSQDTTYAQEMLVPEISQTKVGGNADLRE